MRTVPVSPTNDPEYQKRVIRTALALLDTERCPVLVDYPEDVPAWAALADASAMEGMVCPIDFPRLPDKTAPTSEIGIALMKAIESLAPWYELAVTTRRRTTVGPSGLSIVEAGKYLAGFLENQATPCPRDGLAAGQVLKLAYEDLKA